MQARTRRFIMSTEVIVVVLLIVALAFAGLVYLERNSRKNGKDSEESNVKSEESPTANQTNG